MSRKTASSPVSWIDELTPHAHEVLAGVLERAGIASHAALLRAERGDLSPGARAPRSRQARQAQLTRARSTAMAGALLLATEDDVVRELVLSRELVRLRPYSAETQLKAMSLTPLLQGLTMTGCLVLFEHAFARLLELGSRVRVLPQIEVLRIDSCLSCMYVGPIVFGPAFRGPWCDAYRTAQRDGLLENPHIRLLIAMMGSWVGESEPHIAWLLDHSLRDYDMAESYCFVRRDTGDDLFRTLAAVARGARLDPVQCLLPGRAAATVRGLIEYLLACLRDPSYLSSPGHLLMLLSGVEDAQRHVARMRREGTVVCDEEHLFDALRRFERVQQLEKRSFWSLCDELPEGALKARLLELWTRDSTLGATTREGSLRWDERISELNEADLD